MGKCETDLTRLLGRPALAAKVLATGELMQFRHLNETQGDENAGEAGWLVAGDRDISKDARTPTQTVKFSQDKQDCQAMGNGQ